MKLYYEDKDITLYEGKMQDVLDTLPDNSIDSIVCDPPYDLTTMTKRFGSESSAPCKEGTDGSFARLTKGFMGKTWDGTGVAFDSETWKKALRVLKTGGYLLAFGGTRTFHRMACAIEDAGFEIRDCIMWLYGCLSEDTEILTKNGFKKYNEIKDGDEIRIYDVENDIYKWEKPEKWNIYKVNNDTLYHIKSNKTDQLVSRNHRCFIERDGKLVCEYAENLSKMERMPILSYDIHFIQEGESNILFPELLWQNENLAETILCKWEKQEEQEESTIWRKKSSLERWYNLLQEKRELSKSKHKVCKVSPRVYINGEKRWLCNGTQIISSTTSEKTFVKKRSSPSYKPQCRGQQNKKSYVICNESRPQELRKWKTYKTTLATIKPIQYTGTIFCPTVSTGCFVARRKGKVFITGNRGFPKSHNVGFDVDKINGVESKVVGSYVKQAQNEWAGWGTALKPAYEPIIMARKPMKMSVAQNCLKYGVGAINIDECRVGLEEGYKSPIRSEESQDYANERKGQTQCDLGNKGEYAGANQLGRFPANVITDGSEEVSMGMPYTKSCFEETNYIHDFKGNKEAFQYGYKKRVGGGYEDEGSAMRYFYQAKASKKDRDEGLDMFDAFYVTDGCERSNFETAHTFGASSSSSSRRNIHPTVKPIELMQYLVRLVSPKGATILDCFMGSGSTGKAVMFENRERQANYKFIGIEMTEEYLPIAKARIIYGRDKFEYDLKKERAERHSKGIFDLFDILEGESK